MAWLSNPELKYTVVHCCKLEAQTRPPSVLLSPIPGSVRDISMSEHVVHQAHRTTVVFELQFGALSHLPITQRR